MPLSGIEMEIIAGILDKAISEDLGSGDITSMAVIPEDTKIRRQASHTGTYDLRGSTTIARYFFAI